MSRMYWYNLTDSELSSRLEGLPRDEHCEELLLSSDRLTSVPDLTQYRQFDNLRGLDIIDQWHLSELRAVQPGHIPRSVTHLNLSGNYLSEVCDFSGHSSLSDLNLSNTNISVIQPRHIPRSVSRLDLSENELSEVCDFSGHSLLSVLNLRHNNISVIQPRHIPRSVSRLDLSENELSEVCDFSGHSSLSDLNLRYNYICVIQPRHIPQSVSHLNLSWNKLSEVRDFSGHSSLCDLNLLYNHIHVIRPSHIPQSVSHLDLSGNNLKEIGDFSRHTSLTKMDTTYNKILTIHGLPNNRIDLQAGSEILVLGNRCFHENTYQMLKELTEDCGWVLQQPPVEILNQGLEAVMEYFDKKFVKSGQARMVLLGPTTAGKTSLMESLVQKMPVLVHLQDRTWVADVTEWNISDVDTISIFDQGGHEIYTITSPFFQAPNSIVLLVHDVTKVEDLELDKTSATLRQALQYHPDNQVYTVLTHTDLLDPEAVEENTDCIKKRLETTIDEEVRNIEMSDTTEEARQQSALLKKQKENMKYFLISSKTYRGLDDLKVFLSHIVAEKRVKIPTKWVKLYKKMMQQNQSFWKIEDLEKLFRKLHLPFEKQFQQSKIANQFTSALRYYRDAGHILFFETIPNLNQFVFHHIEFIIDLLKPCFSHDLRNVIDYRNDQSLQALFSESHMELMLQQYQREGLLRKKLLHYLWRKHKLDVKEMDAFLEPFKLFRLCYPIDKDSQLLFFPWFVKNNTYPNGINPNKLSTLDATHFSVELDCQFVSHIPVNAFEMILVQLQKTALEKEYGGERFAWRDGLLVQIRSIDCIAIRKQADSTVTICVRGYTEDLPSIWQITSDVYSDIKSTLVPFRGVIKTICFNCNHCRANGFDSVRKWLPNDVFPSKPLDVSYQRCHEEDTIPSALVVALSAKVRNVNKHIKRVEDYLGSVHKAVSPPDKLLYLDCEKVADGFQLSWCWPRCRQEGDVFAEAASNTITHAVVQCRQGDRWEQVAEDVNQSPYTFTGIGEEFRIAAANRNGAGEFICVTPYRIVNADEVISASDHKQMKANHEFFTGMSSVWEIVMRLFSRGVIDARAKESVVRKLTIDKNQGQAADLLMESIYRLRYQQLYLFQKTLRETGQMAMADSLPVKVEDEILPPTMDGECPAEPSVEVAVLSQDERHEGESTRQMAMVENLPERLEHEILPPTMEDEGPADPLVEVAVLPQDDRHEGESTMLDSEEDFHTDNQIFTYHRNY